MLVGSRDGHFYNVDPPFRKRWKNEKADNSLSLDTVLLLKAMFA